MRAERALRLSREQSAAAEQRIRRQRCAAAWIQPQKLLRSCSLKSHVTLLATYPPRLIRAFAGHLQGADTALRIRVPAGTGSGAAQSTLVHRLSCTFKSVPVPPTSIYVIGLPERS